MSPDHPTPPAVDYDPFDPATLADPFAAYPDLRAGCPVHHHPDFGDDGFYTLSRHDDVVDLFKDTSRWSADWGQGPIYVKEGGLKSDPPEHTRYRRLISQAFTPRRVAAMEADVRALADELIDAFADRGHADLIAEFAAPFPSAVVSKILGVPRDRQDDFQAWTDEFMAGQNDADPAVQGRARAKFDAYFAGELARRRALVADRPDVDQADLVGEVLPDDVLTSLLLAEHEGTPITDEQLLPLLLLLLVGGIETTRSMIGNLVRRLGELDEWTAVAGDPDRWDVAIEESLRFDPPVLGVFRTAKGEQCVRDVVIPDEAKVEGLYAAANRDPAVWDDPETFRLDRDLDRLRRDQLSFGVGIWFCPGAGLARMEGRIALELLGRRLPGLRLDGTGERALSFMMWGPATLPVRWDPAPT